jgi:NAD(P)-dependent dehydrogenase (short-subunit alcohol dehydrogenase family)
LPPGLSLPGLDAQSLFDVSGRVAIVTGASSGLGARFARVLAGAGARVVVAARRADRLQALVAELGPATMLAVPTDVTRPQEIERLVTAAVDRFGRLDVMVNNAGIAPVLPALEETVEAFSEVLAVNLAATFGGARAAARVMLPTGRGSIINMAAGLGFVGSGKIPQAGYAASKGGVVNLTRELAAQWAPQGVRVNALAPGWFKTEMTESMWTESGYRYIERSVPLRRPGEEHELDGALLFLASDASSYVTGQTIVVDGGFIAV